jgi:hypothetical protein
MFWFANVTCGLEFALIPAVRALLTATGSVATNLFYRAVMKPKQDIVSRNHPALNVLPQVSQISSAPMAKSRICTDFSPLASFPQDK